MIGTYSRSFDCSSSMSVTVFFLFFFTVAYVVFWGEVTKFLSAAQLGWVFSIEV
jgi:hypothetical protein